MAAAMGSLCSSETDSKSTPSRTDTTDTMDSEEKAPTMTDETSLSLDLYAQRKADLKSRLGSWPLETNDISQFDEASVISHMRSAYPIIHGATLVLMERFLQIKRESGSTIEKAYYKDVSLLDLVDRLFTKRPVVFFMSYDSFVDRDGRDGSKMWDAIGTDDETPPRVLVDYVSYDELVLSALCGVSSHTLFINSGSRANCGRKGKPRSAFERTGVYMGLVGSRFERECRMEFVHLGVAREQNTRANGFGTYTTSLDATIPSDEDELRLQKLEQVMVNITVKNRNPVWRVMEEYYGIPTLPLYQEIEQAKKAALAAGSAVESESSDWISKSVHTWHECLRWRDGGALYLNLSAFRMRVTLSVELFLLDAQRRVEVCDVELPAEEAAVKAAYKAKGAYCMAVGLGTGVWAMDKGPQECCIVEQFRESIQSLDLSNVSVVDFSWFSKRATCLVSDPDSPIFKSDDSGNLFCLDRNGHKVEIKFSKRNPADKLRGEYSGMLNTAMFAWDSASFVGNEYWIGALSASGDPAAACCSTISFIQNSEINCEHISGRNARVYFSDGSNYRLEDLVDSMEREEWLQKSIDSMPMQHRVNGSRPETLEEYLSAI